MATKVNDHATRLEQAVKRAREAHDNGLRHACTAVSTGATARRYQLFELADKEREAHAAALAEIEAIAREIEDG